MLEPKACHQGLEPKSNFFGLEALDVLLLVPPLYVCAVLLHQILLGIGVALVLAMALRVMKWGRLPGYSLALFLYLVLPEHNAALGYDRAPPYPRS
jgi:hypothetical protein